MTALLVERTGRRVAMAGNIGPTMLQTLADALDAAAREGEPQPLPDVWVLELSSFQLDEAKGFEPDAATVLNITEDHLDWHGSMAAYVAAKARIFGKHAVMVINRDDAAVEKLVPEPIPQKGRGAKPIECTKPSNPGQRSPSAANIAAICASSPTSQSNTRSLPNSRANSVIRSRKRTPTYENASSAPSRLQARAMP